MYVVDEEKGQLIRVCACFLVGVVYFIVGVLLYVCMILVHCTDFHLCFFVYFCIFLYISIVFTIGRYRKVMFNITD